MNAPGRHSAGRGGDDSGFTLIELMVAVALFTMLSIALGSVAVLAIRTSTGLGTRLDNATQGQSGMSAVSKVLRTAVQPTQLADQRCVGCAETALVTATPSRVSFYANLNNTGSGPSLVTIEVVQDAYTTRTRGVLRLTMQPPTVVTGGQYTFCLAGAPGCVVNTRVVTEGLDWPATAVFTYYDYEGLPIPSGALTSGNLATVSSVDVSLTVQTIPGQTGVPSHSAVQRIRLPNAETTVLQDPS